MNYSDYRFTLDVQIHQSQVSVPVTLGDSARRLCIGLTDGRKPYTIEDGCRAVFNAKKPDGNTIKNDCIIERNTILYEFTEQTTNAEGVVNCDITIYDTDGKVLTSPQFIIVVDKRVVRDEEVPISESEATAIGSIIRSEASRVEAEKSRATAESAREAADIQREDEMRAFKVEVNDKVEAQNVIIGTCEYELYTRLQKQDERMSQRIGDSGIATLMPSDWTDWLTQKISIPDLGDGDLVIFYPASKDDREYCGIYGIFINPHSLYNEFTAAAAEKPMVQITLEYYIIRGRLPELEEVE